MKRFRWLAGGGLGAAVTLLVGFRVETTGGGVGDLCLIGCSARSYSRNPGTCRIRRQPIRRCTGQLLASLSARSG